MKPDRSFQALMLACGPIILQRNEFPAGGTEIIPDVASLEAIQLSWQRPLEP